MRNTRAEDPLLTPLAKKHSKSPAQILLRWGLQKGFVILPKSVTKSRIEENRNIYDFELDAEDMRSLETGRYEPCAWVRTEMKDYRVKAQLTYTFRLAGPNEGTAE